MLILISVVFLLSGCSFEYNINIDDNVILEDNIVYIENTNSNNIESKFEEMVSKYTGPTNSLGMYESSIINSKNNVGISYKKNYSYTDYNYSVSFSSCYDSYKLVNDEGKIIIATSDVFKCFDKYDELDEVTVNLTTKYKVEESNADNVKKNTYTWNINKNNAGNKKINIVIDTGISSYNENNKFGLNVFVLSIIVMLLFGIIIYFVKLRDKSVNKI